MSCRNQCCNQQGNWANESGAGQGSGCRRTGCFTATVPVTVTYQITPDLYDERAIVNQINNNRNAGGDDWSDPSCGCGCGR